MLPPQLTGNFPGCTLPHTLHFIDIQLKWYWNLYNANMPSSYFHSITAPQETWVVVLSIHHGWFIFKKTILRLMAGTDTAVTLLFHIKVMIFFCCLTFTLCDGLSMLLWVMLLDRIFKYLSLRPKNTIVNWTLSFCTKNFKFHLPTVCNVWLCQSRSAQPTLLNFCAVEILWTQRLCYASESWICHWKAQAYCCCFKSLPQGFMSTESYSLQSLLHGNTPV